MLIGQKRYLFPLYLLLNGAMAILFCIFSLVICRCWMQAPASHPFFSKLFCGLLLYYLVPTYLFVALVSKKIWFGEHLPKLQSAGMRYLSPIIVVVFVLLITLCSMPALGLSFTISPIIESRHFILIGLGYVFSMTILLVARWGLVLFIKNSDAASHLIQSVVIVGTGERAREVARKINGYPEWGMRTTGFISKTAKNIGTRIESNTIIGSTGGIGDVLNHHIADLIIIAADSTYLSSVDSIVQRCRLEGIDIGFVTTRKDICSPFVVETVETVTLAVLRFIHQRPEMLFYKRAFDLMATSLLCFLLLPFFIVIPLLIWRDSSGPALFRQERVGKNGRRFYMYKFRSMMVDAEKRKEELLHLNEMDGPTFKIKEDPRVTRIGSFLRKNSLDELPQLFNVLKGELSLVGPRPPLFNEVAQYRPWEKKRLSTVQGITGLWQVSGRNEIKFDEWMKLDLMYVEEWSFVLDLLILVKTVPAVIAMKGAQ
jgi:exopolysaccharide biosynthesis polyprenyl glycosylphosphotransferase